MIYFPSCEGLFSSPALDAGSNALATDANGNPLINDQRGIGFPRVVHGTVDIGAYESFFIAQTISFSPLARQTYGVLPITLTATATSGLPVSFRVIFGSATLSGNVLTINGAGNVQVEASQAWNTTYYAATTVVESVTVTPAFLTITVNNSIKAYGAAMPPLSVNYSGLVNGDSAANLATPPTLATAASASSPVLPGGYAIVASGASDPDYAVAYQPGTLLITPAPLTIWANSASMYQGMAVPSLAVNYYGFVNGDSPASLASQPAVTTPANPLSPAGAYPIVAGGANSPNYSINYVNSVLVVTPAPVRVLSVSVQAVRLGKTKKTTQVIVLQFTGALNAGNAQSIGTYSLTTIPATKKQKSKAVALSQATYNPANNTVRLVSRSPLVLNPSLKLTINAARLFDTLGRPLDGDHDGQPGGNFTATLSKAGTTIA